MRLDNTPFARNLTKSCSSKFSRRLQPVDFLVPSVLDGRSCTKVSAYPPFSFGRLSNPMVIKATNQYADYVIVNTELFVHNELDPEHKRARKELRKLQRLAQMAGNAAAKKARGRLQ